MKICSNCEVRKRNSEFYARKASDDGLAFNCKACSNLFAKTWNDENEEKRFKIRRSSHLRRKFGITLEQYEALLKQQNNACAICERDATMFPRELAVDHDHVTLRIRGLLCTACNYRLVAKHRDGELLRKIANYVEQGTDWYTPAKKKRRRSTPRGKTKSA